LVKKYWEVYPSLKNELFKTVDNRPEHVQLKIETKGIKAFIFQHPEFARFGKQMDAVFEHSNIDNNYLEKRKNSTIIGCNIAFIRCLRPAITGQLSHTRQGSSARSILAGRQRRKQTHLDLHR